MGMGGNWGTGNVRSEINITPLVDVVLVLLIIFMVATPILQMGLDVDVPPKVSVTTPAPEAAADQLVVVVREEGLFLNGARVGSLDELRATLEQRLAGRPANEKVVFLDSEDALTFDRAVAAMDVAYAAGAETVGFLTEPAG